MCRFLFGNLLEFMQDYGETFGKVRKIPVCCENGQVAPDDDGTNKKICIPENTSCLIGPMISTSQV